MDRMVADGGTRTEGDRTGAAGILVAGILAVGMFALGISAGPAEVGDILGLEILEAGILAVAGIPVPATAGVILAAVAGMAVFRVNWVLHVNETADLTEEDSGHFPRGSLRILDLRAAVGRAVAEPGLAGRIRRAGPGTPQGRIGALASGLRLRSAQTGRPVRSGALGIGQEIVVGAQEMVRAAGREGIPFLTQIDHPAHS
jgi:hypothetical protein